MAESPKTITVKLEFDSEVFQEEVRKIVRLAQMEAWAEGVKHGRSTPGSRYDLRLDRNPYEASA